MASSSDPIPLLAHYEDTLRRQIAGELHDRCLTELAMLRGQISAGASADILKARVDKVMADIRQLIHHHLRPQDLDVELGTAVRALISEYQKHGYPIELTLDLPESVLQATGLAANEVFLILREAITNAHRSGKMVPVTVVGTQKDGQVVFCIQDGGAGFDVESAEQFGHGLNIMRARAQRIQGELEIRSQMGVGTTVTLSLNPHSIGLNSDVLDCIE